MAEQAVAVVDTGILLNLATPVVDGRPHAPSGADPLKALLTGCDVRISASVLEEVTDATGSDDLLSAAADLVLKTAHQLTTHDVDARIHEPLDYGLDRGESEAIWLVNELQADLCVTDEFSTTSYLFVTLALDDRNILFTTPISSVPSQHTRFSRWNTSTRRSPTMSRSKAGMHSM